VNFLGMMECEERLDMCRRGNLALTRRLFQHRPLPHSDLEIVVVKSRIHLVMKQLKRKGRKETDKRGSPHYA
jgi:hypothetical protein